MSNPTQSSSVVPIGAAVFYTAASPEAVREAIAGYMKDRSSHVEANREILKAVSFSGHGMNEVELGNAREISTVHINAIREIDRKVFVLLGLEGKDQPQKDEVKP